MSIVVEEIKVTREQSKSGRRFIVVYVCVNGEWIEVLRDLETSSNDHEVTAKEIQRLVDGGEPR